jgi:hypothetical protein
MPPVSLSGEAQRGMVSYLHVVLFLWIGIGEFGRGERKGVTREPKGLTAPFPFERVDVMNEVDTVDFIRSWPLARFSMQLRERV